MSTLGTVAFLDPVETLHHPWNCYSPHPAHIFVVFDETKGHNSFSCVIFGLAGTIILMGDGVQWIWLVFFVEGSPVGRVLVWGRWERASSDETHS